MQFRNIVLYKTKKIFVVMKISFILLVINLLAVSATAYSQSTRFSFAMKNASVEQVFKEVERNSDFTFLYKIGLIDASKKVDLNVKNATVENILDQILEGTGVSYRVLENNLVILMESTDKALNQILQGITVTGTVVDQTDDPMPGVNIIERGTTNGVVTDADGKFSIRVSGADAILVFSFLGYSSQEIAVAGRQVLSVIMAEDTRQIEEVVVTALGIRREQKAVDMPRKA